MSFYKKIFLLTTIITNVVTYAYSQSKEYVIKYKEHNLHGIISKPSTGSNKQGIVILAHGFGGTHHFGYGYFKTLNQLGYQAYAFDFAHGSPHSQSDNNTMKMSVLDQQQQLECVVEHFRKQPDIDPSRIVLLGESQGGLVSALTAASIQKKINRLILVYPAFCIPYHWKSRYPDLKQVPDTTRFWNIKMGRQYFEEIHDMDAFSIAQKYKKPVLIIHGDADYVVPYSDSERMVKLYKNARLYRIPQGGHGFNPQQFEQSLKYIRDFLIGNSGQ